MPAGRQLVAITKSLVAIQRGGKRIGLRRGDDVFLARVRPT